MEQGVKPEVRPQLLADLTVAEVMDRWPQTVPYFFRYRMACVGCPIAPFETLAEVAAIYGLDLSRFLIELEWTIEQAERT
jgi:hybrid cluster-associated redox disulfide protein